MNKIQPKLAILFWFYKEPSICKNHLELLKQHNPTVPIYGLYGGPLENVSDFESILGSHLDDFYVFDKDKSSSWKWHLGDLLISDWYSQRGKNLIWDTIIIVQWDMLVFAPVTKLFHMLEKDEILLSGIRAINEIEEKWAWTSNSIAPELRSQYLNFMSYVKDKYSFDQDPLCCLFIVVCFPKTFLEKYADIEQPELGFLEYRVPIYSQIFKTPLCLEHPFQPWWPGDSKTEKNRKTLNAKRIDIRLFSILKNLAYTNGTRVFHPYRKKFPLKMGQWIWIFQIVFQEFIEWIDETMKRIRYKKQY